MVNNLIETPNFVLLKQKRAKVPIFKKTLDVLEEVSISELPKG